MDNVCKANLKVCESFYKLHESVILNLIIYFLQSFSHYGIIYCIHKLQGLQQEQPQFKTYLNGFICLVLIQSICAVGVVSWIVFIDHQLTAMQLLLNIDETQIKHVHMKTWISILKKMRIYRINVIYGFTIFIIVIFLRFVTDPKSFWQSDRRSRDGGL